MESFSPQEMIEFVSKKFPSVFLASIGIYILDKDRHNNEITNMFMLLHNCSKRIQEEGNEYASVHRYENRHVYADLRTIISDYANCENLHSFTLSECEIKSKKFQDILKNKGDVALTQIIADYVHSANDSLCAQWFCDLPNNVKEDLAKTMKTFSYKEDG